MVITRHEEACAITAGPEQMAAFIPFIAERILATMLFYVCVILIVCSTDNNVVGVTALKFENEVELSGNCGFCIFVIVALPIRRYVGIWNFIIFCIFKLRKILVNQGIIVDEI